MPCLNNDIYCIHHQAAVWQRLLERTEMEHILITGATGGLGQTAVDYALARGARVLATGRNTEVLSQLAQQGAQTYTADLVAMPDRLLEEKADLKSAVWHCAGLATPWASEEAYTEVNVVLAERMYQAAARAGVPVFVHISSPSLYFDFHSHRDIPEGFQAAHYASGYAASKAEAEKRLQALALRSPNTRLVILRPRVLYGPHDQVFLPRLLRLAQSQHGHLLLPGGGEAVVDLCHLENAAHAMWLATQAKVPSGSVFNITDETPVQVRTAVQEFFSALGLQVTVHGVPYAVLAPVAAVAEWLAGLTRQEPVITRHSLGALAFDTTLDTRAAREQLGYQPVVSLAEGMRQTAPRLLQTGQRRSRCSL